MHRALTGQARLVSLPLHRTRPLLALYAQWSAVTEALRNVAEPLLFIYLVGWALSNGYVVLIVSF